MKKLLIACAVIAILASMPFSQLIPCDGDGILKEATLRPGEKIDFGKYKARLLEVYQDEKAAQMEIMDGTGTSFAQKKLAQGEGFSYYDSTGSGIAVQATFVSIEGPKYIEARSCAKGAPSNYTLLKPDNGITLRAREIDFYVGYDKGDFGNPSASCYLLIDGKKIGPVNVDDGRFNSIAYGGLERGDYSWRMECDGKLTGTRMLHKEEGKPPSISLVAPPDGFVTATGGVRIAYIYKAGDIAPEKVSCELYVDGKFDSRTDAESGESIIAQKVFPRGNYTWQVSCGNGQYALRAESRRIESRFSLGQEDDESAGRNETGDATGADGNATAASKDSDPIQPAYLIAPETVEDGQNIQVRLLYENATPVSGEKIALIGADGKAEAILVTDSKGYAVFGPKAIGAYSYEVPLFGIGRGQETQVMKKTGATSAEKIASAPASELAALAIVAILVFAAAGAAVFLLIKKNAKPHE